MIFLDCIVTVLPRSNVLFYFGYKSFVSCMLWINITNQQIPSESNLHSQKNPNPIHFFWRETCKISLILAYISPCLGNKAFMMHFLWCCLSVVYSLDFSPSIFFFYISWSYIFSCKHSYLAELFFMLRKNKTMLKVL